MKTQTQRAKRFIATLLFATLVLGCPNSPAANSFSDGVQAYNAKKYQKAFEIFKALAEQGSVDGQYNLGLMYGMGDGVSQDYAEAVKWYKKAAEQGNADAQFSLGYMYGKGWGVTQDYVQALMWFNLAAAQGLELAQKIRDIFAKKMTPADTSKAQAMAREWLEKHGQ